MRAYETTVDVEFMRCYVVNYPQSARDDPRAKPIRRGELAVSARDGIGLNSVTSNHAVKVRLDMYSHADEVPEGIRVAEPLYWFDSDGDELAVVDVHGSTSLIVPAPPAGRVSCVVTCTGREEAFQACNVQPRDDVRDVEQWHVILWPSPTAEQLMTGQLSDGSPEVVNLVQGDVSGSVVQANTIYGGVCTSSEPPARSPYLWQVKDFVPKPRLIGRKQEISELATFCTAPSAQKPYRWWVAQKWAGKTALMAWFVLHPPPGVRIVSFFVTARHGTFDDRRAFVSIVLEQLAEILGEPVPRFGHPANEEAYLRQAFDRAAMACASRDERLVLVVDGLDEDRGVTTGQRSIASLLPSSPVEGMRVIVTARPNPPVPSDVVAFHPLRDPAVIRTLATSPAAQVMRDDMVQEVECLLGGTKVDRKLAGLITAARGGLTASDLGQLTDRTTGWVKHHLRTVAARSFDVRPSRWQPKEGREVYLLGHDDLQCMVTERLGEDRLQKFRERLCGWADIYREQEWPADTPEYLLRGYHRMLVTAGDMPRLLELAVDHDRHERLLQLTGNHAQALHEIAVARDLVLDRPKIDLRALARLAVIQNDLAERNYVPTGLPGLWAQLGDFPRAEELATSISDSLRRGIAIHQVVPQMVDAGLVEEAQALAWTVPDLSTRCFALATLARRAHSDCESARANALADQAETLATSIDDTKTRIHVLIHLIGAVAAADPDRARRLRAETNDLLRDLNDAADRIRMTAQAIQAFTVAGDLDRLRELADEAQPVAHNKPLSRVVDMLCDVAMALHSAGDTHRAGDLLERVEQTENTDNPDGFPSSTLVRALAKTGQVERAHTLAALQTAPARTDVWQTLGHVVAAAGDVDLAAELGDKAESIVRAQFTESHLARELAIIGSLFATAGRPAHARALAIEVETLIRQAQTPDRLTRTFVTVARLAAATNQLDTARDFNDRAMEVAEQITALERRADALLDLVEVSARNGDWGKARALSETIDSSRLARARTRFCETAGLAGEFELAWEVAQEIDVAYQQEKVMAGLVRTAATRDLELGEALALRMPRSSGRADLLAELTMTAAAAGRFDQACSLMTAIDEYELRTRAGDFVRTLAALRQYDRAEAYAKSFSDPALQTDALAGLACAVGVDADVTRRCVRHAEAISRLIGLARYQVTALCQLAPAVRIVDGDARARSLLDQAEVLVDTLTAPGQIATALGQVARAACAIEDELRASSLFVRARAQAEFIVDKRESGGVLAGLVEVAASRGWWSQATEIAQSVEDFRANQNTWSTLARIAANDGDWDRAETMTASVTDRVVRWRLTDELAGIAAARGEWARAEQTATSLSSAEGRDTAIKTIFHTALRVGELGWAETFARAMPAELKRVEALASLADGIERNRAESIIAEIMCTGHAMTALDVINKTCPDVPAAMLEEALAIHARHALAT